MDNFDFPGLVKEKVKEMEKQVSNSELSASLCVKCGSGDIFTSFIKDGALVDSSSSCKVENEFIYSVEYAQLYKLKALKEHLAKHCRNCQYQWRENTKDA